MSPETIPPCAIGAELSRTTGASSNALLAETQQQHRHQSVHRDAAIVCTENMTQDAALNKVRKIKSKQNRKQHAIGCESSHICVNDRQLRILPTAGIRRELRDHFIDSHNSKPPWSTKAFIHTVRQIEHHHVDSSGSFTDEFHDKRPWEYTKQALKTVEEATKSYMVEVIPQSHFKSSN
jgi:hypothetical protein